MSEFDFMANVPIGPSRGELRQAALAAWKEQWGVWTYESDMGRDGLNWLGICLPRAHKELEEYEITADELRDPICLFAGYCRILDEAGLMAEGDTEEEVCTRIAANLGFVKP